MKIAIHQPEHLPWAGFFYKMLSADIFVFLDHVQFEKGGWQNRNKLKDIEGKLKWVTVPVHLKSYQDRPLNEIEIVQTVPWRRKYLKFIKHNYFRSPYFNKYFPPLLAILKKEHSNLVNLNKELIAFFCIHLNVQTDIVSSFDTKSTLKRDDLLIQICKQYQGTQYLVGRGAENYLRKQLFDEAKIDVVECSFDLKQYGDYAYEKSSILDALFFLGPQCKDFLRLGQLTPV